MSESEADRAGLVPTHAYALLDIRKVKVCLHSLFSAVTLVLPRVVGRRARWSFFKLLTQYTEKHCHEKLQRTKFGFGELEEDIKRENCKDLIGNSTLALACPLVGPC